MPTSPSLHDDGRSNFENIPKSVPELFPSVTYKEPAYGLKPVRELSQRNLRVAYARLVSIENLLRQRFNEPNLAGLIHALYDSIHAHHVFHAYVPASYLENWKNKVLSDYYRSILPTAEDILIIVGDIQLSYELYHSLQSSLYRSQFTLFPPIDDFKKQKQLWNKITLEALNFKSVEIGKEMIGGTIEVERR